MNHKPTVGIGPKVVIPATIRIATDAADVTTFAWSEVQGPEPRSYAGYTLMQEAAVVGGDA